MVSECTRAVSEFKRRVSEYLGVFELALFFVHVRALVCLCCVFMCVVSQDFYEADQYIVREGAAGDTFYIINKGEVLTRAQSKSISI